MPNGDKNITKNFADNLRRIRKMYNLTQQAFSDRLAINPKSLASYEEARATPNLSVLLQISRYLGYSIESLLSEDWGGIKVFFDKQPETPYNINDVWIIPGNNWARSFRCAKSRASGPFNQADFIQIVLG